VESESRIDIIPVDYAADAIERLLRLPSLKHRRYHISAGLESSVTCGEFQEAVSRVDPRAQTITLSSRLGKKTGGRSDLLRQRLEESISYYVPFMSADIVYSNARLKEACPALGPSPKVTEYLHTLLGQFEYHEGIEESARP
jgi:nucleoside-diphosphate-sugar epimerase